jgi:hypothetical protein
LGLRVHWLLRIHGLRLRLRLRLGRRRRRICNGRGAPHDSGTTDDRSSSDSFFVCRHHISHIIV